MNQLKERQLILVAVCLLALIAGGAAQVSTFEAEDESGEEAELGSFKGKANRPIGGAGLGGAISAMGGSLRDFMGGRKVAPLTSARLEGASATSSIVASGGAAPSATAAAVLKEEEAKELVHLKPHEWFKLIFSPIELIKAIAAHFKLPLKGFVELITKGYFFAVEIVLSPVLVSLKIIEKVFVPDTCRLKFMCQIGTQLNLARDKVLQLSPHFIEGSHHVKALTDGIIGRDCDATFIACEPKLKKGFEELKTGARALNELKPAGEPAAKAEGAVASATV